MRTQGKDIVYFLKRPLDNYFYYFTLRLAQQTKLNEDKFEQL